MSGLSQACPRRLRLLKIRAHYQKACPGISNLPSRAAPPEFSNVLHSHPWLWDWTFFPLWSTGWNVYWVVSSSGVWNPEELSLA
ncbi:hypothetical protein XELAEV_18002368mg [Xenopus laevis]|nr:hypothetical protein XELAEV_18002368mg [Xenopus laevis]